MTDRIFKKGLGYLRGFRSPKDYRPNTKEVQDMYKKTKIKINLKEVSASLPTKNDSRKRFTPVRDQGDLGSCTAFAVAGLLEYMQLNANKSFTLPSTRFIYKTTRMLQGLPGDTGAYIKNAIGSVVLFGAPPEKYWKYNGLSESLNPDFNIEPTAFCYAFGQNYQAIKYVRLDHPDVTSKDVIKKMKEHIVKGLPNIFGFTCFETLRHPTTSSGKIPFPDTNERDIGGHAVVTAGYDDAIEVTNPISKESTKGAFLIRNSWGEEWGESGYGWLPYKYFEDMYAEDVWVLLKTEWIDEIPFIQGE